MHLQTQRALADVARALAQGSSGTAYSWLPSVRKGARLHLASHTVWFGKAYDVVGTVEVTPRTVRSGAVMIRLKVEWGVERTAKGVRQLDGKSVWLPWSPSYVQARLLAEAA